MYYNLGLVGYGVDRSFSPLIHTHFLANSNINGGYSVYSLADPVELPVLMHFLERFRLHGLNVTVPHKQAVLNSVQEADEQVRFLHAANTLHFTDRWHAYNTDIYGFSRMLDLNNIDVSGKSILIFGAGGGARAAAYVLAERGVKSFTVANRSKDKASEMTDIFSGMDINYYNYERLKVKESFDIVINASSADYSNKLWLEHFWADKSVILGGNMPEIAIDLQYGRSETPFLKLWDCSRKYDGFTMLVEQAAKSFEIWFGKMPVYYLDNLRRIAYTL